MECPNNSFGFSSGGSGLGSSASEGAVTCAECQNNDFGFDHNNPGPSPTSSEEIVSFGTYSPGHFISYTHELTNGCTANFVDFASGTGGGVYTTAGTCPVSGFSSSIPAAAAYPLSSDDAPAYHPKEQQQFNYGHANLFAQSPSSFSSGAIASGSKYPQFTPPNGFIPKPIVSKWQTKFVDYFTDKPRGRPITTDEPLNLYTVITPEEAKRLASARYQRILRARQRSKEEAKQAANKKVIDEGNAHIVSTLKRIAEMQAVIKKKKFELAKARARYAELRERVKDVPGSEWIAKVEEDEDVYPGPQQGDYQLFYDTIVNRGFRRN